MFTKNLTVQTPQMNMSLSHKITSYSTLHKESTATLTSVRKIKNFTKIKVKKSPAADNLRIP